VFSRSDESRRQFADEMAVALNVEVQPVADAGSAVVDADIVLIATSSVEPVVDHRNMKPDVHINTVGPKFMHGHEISAAAAEDAARIVSDSPQQIAAHGQDYFLAQSSALARVEHLGGLDQSVSRSGRSLFLSAGLAGTEVLVAKAILRANT
jgi:ornithine cyclodeaminase